MGNKFLKVHKFAHYYKFIEFEILKKVIILYLTSCTTEMINGNSYIYAVVNIKNWLLEVSGRNLLPWRWFK
jgi:hypothetical protein